MTLKGVEKYKAITMSTISHKNITTIYTDTANIITGYINLRKAYYFF